MCELSAADGFVEINESLGEMIKYVGNEPSVGLYYIQLHAQTAVPNVVKLKNTVKEKSQELSLHTEDLEDSIAMTSSMKQCGFSIIDEMIADIKTSLTVISTKQPVKGVILPRSSSYQIGGTNSRDPVTPGRGTVIGVEIGEGSYFSNVIKSAKVKAGNLKWPPLELNFNEPRALGPGINDATDADDSDELPLSSPVEGEMLDDETGVLNKEQESVLLAGFKDYDEFKADKESRLEEWLKGNHQYISS